jgi:hypothetical protein
MGVSTTPTTKGWSRLGKLKGADWLEGKQGSPAGAMGNISIVPGFGFSFFPGFITPPPYHFRLQIVDIRF